MTKSGLTSSDAAKGEETQDAFLDLLWQNRPLPPLRPGEPLSKLADVIDRAVALERAGDDLSAPPTPLPEQRDWRTRCFRLYRHLDGSRFELAMEQWDWIVLEWMRDARGHRLEDVLPICDAHRGGYTRSWAMRFYTQEYLGACVRHYGLKSARRGGGDE